MQNKQGLKTSQIIHELYAYMRKHGDGVYPVMANCHLGDLRDGVHSVRPHEQHGRGLFLHNFIDTREPLPF